MAKLPSFFLVGAPKAGTTSLSHYLDQHPQIYMSAVKEPNYFASEIREENFAPDLRRWMEREKRDLRAFLAGPMREKRFGGIVTEWEDYLRLFANASTEIALGEASVCYLWSPSAPARIAAKIPDARILAMLRNPVERAYSQYLHGLGAGAYRWSFREHIQLNLSDRSGQLCRHYPFLELGLYSAQLERYRKAFGERVWVGLYDRFRDRPLEVFREICQFLGVRTDFEPDMAKRRLEAQVPRAAVVGWLKRSGLWRAAARITPKKLRPLLRRGAVRAPGSMRMDPEDRRFLVDYYREDVSKLETMLDVDLGAWLR